MGMILSRVQFPGGIQDKSFMRGDCGEWPRTTRRRVWVMPTFVAMGQNPQDKDTDKTGRPAVKKDHEKDQKKADEKKDDGKDKVKDEKKPGMNAETFSG